MSDIYKAPEAPLHNDSTTGTYGSVESALAGRYELRPIQVVKDAWAMLKGMKGAFWGAALIYGVIVAIFSVLSGFAMGDFGGGEPNYLMYGLLTLLQAIVVMPIVAGLFMIGIKHSVGAPAEFKQIFQHFDKTIPLFLTTLLVYILVAIGLVLLIVPGVYLLLSYSMAIPLVVEKNMSPWQALETSRKAITHKWFNMLGFALVTLLVVVAGALALLVGLIWAYPLLILAFGLVYRNIFGVEPETIQASQGS